MAAKVKEVVVPMDTRIPKKRVVRFQTDEDNAAVSNIYVTNEALKKIGDPDEIEVVIRPKE